MDAQRLHLDRLVERYPDLLPARESVAGAAALLLETIRRGGTILLCGNGGSAADSTHIAAELLKSLARPRKLSPGERALFAPGEDTLAENLQGAIRAIALPDLGVIHSAWANDVDAEYGFAQLVWALGRPGDALWAISTSGNSANVNHALTVARRKGMRTIGLTGRDGGKMAPLCDAAIIAPGANTQEIQERHLPIYHAICLILEASVFP